MSGVRSDPNFMQRSDGFIDLSCLTSTVPIASPHPHVEFLPIPFCPQQLFALWPKNRYVRAPLPFRVSLTDS